MMLGYVFVNEYDINGSLSLKVKYIQAVLKNDSKPPRTSLNFNFKTKLNFKKKTLCISVYENK